MDVELLSGACGAEIIGINLRDTSGGNIKIIKDLVSHYKISFIVATHNLSIVKKFDKIIKLSEGKLI